jgi:hypothetical protein
MLSFGVGIAEDINSYNQRICNGDQCFRRAGIRQNMNPVDSSARLAYFADTKNSGKFGVPIENTIDLLCPTIVIYLVFKVRLREKVELEAIISQAYLPTEVNRGSCHINRDSLA